MLDREGAKGAVICLRLSGASWVTRAGTRARTRTAMSGAPAPPHSPMAAVAPRCPAQVSARPRTSPPSAPRTLKPRMRALLPSCSPGPGVRDDEVLVGDVKGNGVWESHRQRGPRYKHVEGRVTWMDSGTLDLSCICMEQCSAESRLGCQAEDGRWAGRGGLLEGWCASLLRTLGAVYNQEEKRNTV